MDPAQPSISPAVPVAPASPAVSAPSPVVPTSMPLATSAQPAVAPAPVMPAVTSFAQPSISGGFVDGTSQGKPASPAQVASVAGGHPEIHPAVLSAPVEAKPETADIEVIQENPEVSPELAEHIQAVTHGEVQLPGPIPVGQIGDQQVSVSPAAPSQPNIVLPLSQDDVTTGQKHPVNDAFRWLSEWVVWVIKKYPGRVFYKS